MGLLRRYLKMELSTLDGKQHPRCNSSDASSELAAGSARAHVVGDRRD
jgi:hypothetical protein